MEKTLSLGAFEELSENEVMVTEGGIGIIAVTALVGAAVVGVLAFPIVANTVVRIINNINDSCVPTGTPNPNHIWTVF